MTDTLTSLQARHAKLTSDIRYWETRYGAQAKQRLAELINQRASIKAKIDAIEAARKA